MNDHWLLAFVKRVLGKDKPKAPTSGSLSVPPPVAPKPPVVPPAPVVVPPTAPKPNPLPSFLIPRADRPTTSTGNASVGIDVGFSTESGSTPTATPGVPTKHMYVNSHIGLRVRSEPKIANNILEILLYGDMVTIDRQEESWAHVEYSSGLTGWVSVYYLSEDAPPDALVTPVAGKVPHFVIAQPNRASDVNTVEIRRVIGDEFGGGKNGWDLQCTEYVQYRLAERGIKINWPADRPRNGGKWAEIFARHNMYHVSNEPSVGSAMCFTAGFATPASSEIGHVAYVEGVFADGSVKVSEANWPPPGRYNERIIPKREWQDRYKARFVKFT